MALADEEREPVVVRSGVRSEVGGYGAAPYTARGGTVYYVDAADQGLHRLDPFGPRNAPVALTEADGEPVRYGAPRLAHDGRLVFAVRERGAGRDAAHEVVAVPADGSGPPRVLAAAHDFHGAPAVHPSERRIAFTAWNHPHMPWDESVLLELRLDGAGAVTSRRVVAAAPGVSVTQPCYAPDGRLYFVDDRSGWWNLRADGADTSPAPMAAEFGRPDWCCGLTTYGFLDDGGIVAAYRARGEDAVAVIGRDGAFRRLPLGRDVVDALATGGGEAVAVAASGRRAAAVVRLPADGAPPVELRSGQPDPPGPEWISEARRFAFESDGQRVLGLYYPPRNPECGGPEGVPPPLLLSCHGGPTVVAVAALTPHVQYWTSRGYAVAEVNYGGSAGHGRAYRERLRGRWGILDAADCVNAARHLVAEGLADPRRLAVRGRSSGGLTALNAAAAGGGFAAVVSYAGVTDPAAIPDRTHRMESRYLDGLIGPWPAEREEYAARSPLRGLGSWTAATLVFHGARDPVVPLEQAERLRDGLRDHGVPVDLVVYPEEGHALRRPDTVRHLVATEAAFLTGALRLAENGTP
ncbi:S9 family peptidase [Streptomyces sp. AJS327]|nr:S9 family peptidase [Streptomyces sp. AJS327]